MFKNSRCYTEKLYNKKNKKKVSLLQICVSYEQVTTSLMWIKVNPYADNL